MKKVVITSLCLTSGAAVASAQVKLSFNPEAGAKYEYRTEVAQNIKQSSMGRELPIEETVTMTCAMEVTGKKAKKTAVKLTWQDVSCLLSSPMFKMGYDSKKPNANPSELDKIHEKICGSVVGKSFELAITPAGDVNSVTGVGAIAEGIKRSVSASGPMGEQLSASYITQWLGEDAVKGMIEQSFKIYPAGEVKTGDSWSTESKYGISNKKSKIKTVYTLKDVQNAVATVAVAATVELAPEGGLEGRLAGTQSGVILIDVKTGIPVSSDLTLSINGTVRGHGNEMLMKMDAKIKTSIGKIN